MLYTKLTVSKSSSSYAWLLCRGHLEIWRPTGLYPHAPPPPPPSKSHQIAVVKKIASASVQQIVKQNRATRTWRRRFSVSLCLIKKKKGERSMYMEKKYFCHCSCFWWRATAGLWTWRCCVSDECACVRVSTTLALQVHFPLLHRKEIAFFRRSTTRENIFATRHGLPRGCESKDDWPPAFLKARSPHSRRAGETFPQAIKSDITLVESLCTSTPRQPHRCTPNSSTECRSRRCRKFFQHTLHNGQGRLSTSPQWQSPARS